MDGRWFAAKDIKSILDISASQLFYWGQTWGLITPEIKGKGRAHKDKYSFINLLDLALIKELRNFGFEPIQIKEIIEPFPNISDVPEEWKGSIWNYVKAGRDDRPEYDEQAGNFNYPGLEKTGCVLLIYKHNEKYRAHIENNELHLLTGTILKMEEKRDFNCTLVINLMKILRELEAEVGEKL